MQGCHLDLLGRQCPRAPEERLTTVEPWKRIRLTIIARKIDLGPVEGLAKVVAVVVGRRWGLAEGALVGTLGASVGARTVNGAIDCTGVLGR
jgi:hypothetical protein